MAAWIKFTYLVGLADGFRKAQAEISPDVEKARETTPNLLPAGSGFPAMIAALDEFYSDSQNLDIPIPMAARHHRAKVEGILDAKQLSESLKRLRILYKMSKELDSLGIP
jgi:outer membrane usher protein FimD/PapC